MGSICFTFAIFHFLTMGFAVEWKRPPDFPRGMDLQLTRFANWADEIIVNNVWTAYPRTGQDVLRATNWAREHNYTIRACGEMHNWSPLVVSSTHNAVFDEKFYPNLLPASKVQEEPLNVILLKTRNYLHRMKIINSDPKNASFWAEPGILFDQLLQILEKQQLGFLAIPAPGSITLGGALSIGAHGAGIPAKGEVLTPGHTYGSLSNLILAFTAVVFDPVEGRYVLKDFHRSEKDAAAFLVSFGRTFLTNVTMRVGPLDHLRCQSFTNFSVQELFAEPDVQVKYTKNNSVAGEIDENSGVKNWSGKRTLSQFVEESGRLEVIVFPFTTHPWLKVWTVTKEKPERSRHVPTPYNYAFTDQIPLSIATLITHSLRIKDKIKRFSTMLIKVIQAGLASTNTSDIWGTSRAVSNFVSSDTLRMTAMGYAIHFKRPQLQNIVREIYLLHSNLLDKYSDANMYPANGPLEMRVGGVDDPSDMLIPHAQPTLMSPSSPVKIKTASGGEDTLDTIVWMSALSYPRTTGVSMFMAEFEEKLREKMSLMGAVLRPEWSKGWAYNRTDFFAWSNFTTLNQHILAQFGDQWEFTRRTLNRYDPFGIFMNPFLKQMFKPHIL